mmetsp:Transcript_24156/g.69725  ORF Transcript_24156/g.69725 Transcript_24156/m.69725 type:complete len:278 (+) Transcript_24156:729-1562(+)
MTVRAPFLTTCGEGWRSTCPASASVAQTAATSVMPRTRPREPRSRRFAGRSGRGRTRRRASCRGWAPSRRLQAARGGSPGQATGRAVAGTRALRWRPRGRPTLGLPPSCCTTPRTSRRTTRPSSATACAVRRPCGGFSAPSTLTPCRGPLPRSGSTPRRGPWPTSGPSPSGTRPGRSCGARATTCAGSQSGRPQWTGTSRPAAPALRGPGSQSSATGCRALGPERLSLRRGSGTWTRWSVFSQIRRVLTRTATFLPPTFVPAIVPFMMTSTALTQRS